MQPFFLSIIYLTWEFEREQVAIQGGGETVAIHYMKAESIVHRIQVLALSFRVGIRILEDDPINLALISSINTPERKEEGSSELKIPLSFVTLNKEFCPFRDLAQKIKSLFTSDTFFEQIPKEKRPQALLLREISALNQEFSYKLNEGINEAFCNSGNRREESVPQSTIELYCILSQFQNLLLGFQSGKAIGNLLL